MIHIIGVGPEEKCWLPPIMQEIAAACDLLIGNSRMRNLFPECKKTKYLLSASFIQTIELLKNHIKDYTNIGVLVSGDPGFFGIVPLIKEEFPLEETKIYPAISSLQLLFARAGISWNNASFIDLEGQDLSTLPRAIFKPLAVLLGEDITAQQVAQLLLERGQNPQISIGFSLGRSNEYFETVNAVKLAHSPRKLNNVILLIYPIRHQNSWQSLGLRIGIPDKDFIRGEAPMTKAEIRVQVLAKAQISLYDHILDVGSGTGSISIEAAAIANEGMVYAIENNAEAQQLIRANMRKFAVPNLKLVSGTAPEVFTKIPPVNVCLINGTQGRLKEVLEEAPLVQGGRIVVTAVSMEKASRGLELLKSLDYEDIEVVSLQAVRWPEVNSFHIAQALNPVFILSARKIVHTS
ncbi:MAG: precorrin-6y C5,15-methyltransferase (decarboxylating) subunit CbiE [Peptococcaceae bacterium]|nr:precorrin-6y C5,15-methyltransferase (decarboxylating) subunit CbiE [Peptococcaceae bacterium]